MVDLLLSVTAVKLFREYPISVSFNVLADSIEMGIKVMGN